MTEFGLSGLCKSSKGLFKLFQRSKLERLAKIVNGFYPLTIFEMRSILDVWQGSENTSDFHLKFLRNIPYKIKWVPGFK